MREIGSIFGDMDFSSVIQTDSVPQHVRRSYYIYDGLTPIEFNFFCIVLLMYEVLKMIEVRYTVNCYLYFVRLFII